MAAIMVACSQAQRNRCAEPVKVRNCYRLCADCGSSNLKQKCSVGQEGYRILYVGLASYMCVIWFTQSLQ
jgi:hypothetical protein